MTGVTVNNALFTFFSDPGTIDNTAGKVKDTIFNRFEGASGHFLIATVNFKAMGMGTTSLDLTESSLNPFSSASAGSSLKVLFEPGSVTVVPVPAAVWLLGSGLLGLIGVARRKPREAGGRAQ